MASRSRKGLYNTMTQFILQIVTAVCGFILPRLILESFGSIVNGTITSIAQFLGIISLLESGFGRVAKTEFYKPLALNDQKEISGVFNATSSFFKKIALMFAGYCLVLAFVYPFFKVTEFDYFFLFFLVIIIGFNSFSEYYFDISYATLLSADQKSYITSILRIITIILNTLICYILLRLGASIIIVKSATAIIFLIRPLLINIYGRRYKIDKKAPKSTNMLKHRWDNFGQSIATYVHTKTDYILMTFLLSAVEISVYSVYSLVTISLSSFIAAISGGFVPGLGNMYSKNEDENLKKTFSLYEFVNTYSTVLIFSVAAVMIIPFIKIYTRNVTDVSYIRPAFGYLLIMAETIYCMRLPYYYVITNAGQFKQIKKGAYIEVTLNIIISLSLIHFIGITGLAIGTLVGMLYRTVELIIYCSKNVLKTKPYKAFLRLMINMIIGIISILIISFIPFNPDTVLSWVLMAIAVAAIIGVLLLLFNIIFYKNDIKTFIQKFKGIIKK